MLRVKLLFLSTLVLAGIFYYELNWVYRDKPADIRYLDRQISKWNERLITAQILASKLEHVYSLFENNLALSARDTLVAEASMPFLNWLTNTFNKLDIKLISIRPKPPQRFGRHYETPYEFEIECNFKQLGKLMTIFEQSPRLIAVHEFNVKNGIQRLKNTRDIRLLQKHRVEMKIATLTLIKS